MPRIAPAKASQLVRAFTKLGFQVLRQTGSHVMMIRSGIRRPLVIPRHGDEEVPVFIITGLLRTGGISREQYLNALSD